MGGGNGQKAAKARERNQARAAAEAKGSQSKMNAAAMSIVCKTCFQSFLCNASEAVLKQHAENKHPKHNFYDCFPHLKPA
mmetsp:Transcript_24464/g.66770  ORF Transcript_24464/g.66770 Transcript_24464/m.66770 type:complete len:80 (-) Transcript_24464:79-318(-)